ncbi:MAG: hypothetical protein GX996_09350, partial [Firmicutes bacterium]|nr:hypothetical protein [Bacillota bacterium]
MAEKTVEKKPHRVLVSGPIPVEGVALLEKVAHVEVLVNPAPSQLKEAISSYDALLVSDGTVVDAETIAAGRQLKVIGRVGMGADNI